MSWDYRLTKQALKQLRKFPSNDVARLFVALENMKISPYFGDIEKLRGEENVWRRRVGWYRILFAIFQTSHMIHVYDIKRRTSKTY